MKILLRSLTLRTRQSIEYIDFSEHVTFLHGPVSTGKSTVARLIDYCLGGGLERTPALQSEFVAAELELVLGDHECRIERASSDTQSVRVTWSGPSGGMESVDAPLSAQAEALIDEADVHNFSDLVFHLCGVSPIKVRQRRGDPESAMVRLSIRDIWWYCYLEQTHLDSSFFHLEDSFRGRKSQDAMRFFTGLHSERLSQLEDELAQISEKQRTKREAVLQIREFMRQFEFGSESEILEQIETTRRKLTEDEGRRRDLERTRVAQTHPTDELRGALRLLSGETEGLRGAINDLMESIEEQKSLRAELITAKTKAVRSGQASVVLEGVRYQRCPECGTHVSDLKRDAEHCRLCGSPHSVAQRSSLELEALRRDLNERIDQIADSIERRQRESDRMRKQLLQVEGRKASLDRQLQDDLARYDSAFVESIRGTEREIATLPSGFDFLSD